MKFTQLNLGRYFAEHCLSKNECKRLKDGKSEGGRGKFSLVEPGIKGRTDEGANANGFGGWYRMSQK